MPGPEASAAAGQDAQRASRRLLAALVIGQLGLHSTMAGVRMAAPLQTLREGYSPWAVGVLLALFAAAPVLTAMPAGRAADRLGYHPLVGTSIAVAVLGAALALGASFLGGPLHFALLCLAAMLCGTAANVGMLTIQRTAGLSARDAVERVRVFSWLGIAPSLANVVGPVAVGLTIDAAGFAAGYALMLTLPLATLATLRRVPRQDPPRAATPARGGGAREVLQAPGMPRLLWLSWFLSMCWDVHAFAVPVLGHERGFSAGTIGLILGAFTLSVTGVRALIPLLAHRLSETGVMRGAMLATALVFAAYPLAPNAWAMASLALLLGLALGAVQPMVMSILHQLTPHHRHGEALAVRSMAINASSTVMPLVFGAVGTAVGAAVLFWAVGVVVGSGSWLVRGLRASTHAGAQGAERRT